VGVNRDVAAEVVAVAIYERTPAAVTMPLVHAVIAELCKHPPECPLRAVRGCAKSQAPIRTTVAYRRARVRVAAISSAQRDATR
jgi:hypothetical protein